MGSKYQFYIHVLSCLKNFLYLFTSIANDDLLLFLNLPSTSQVTVPVLNKSFNLEMLFDFKLKLLHMFSIKGTRGLYFQCLVFPIFLWYCTLTDKNSFTNKSMIDQRYCYETKDYFIVFNVWWIARSLVVFINILDILHF